MYDRVIACLDGSSLAEKILPLARGLVAVTGGRLTLLRIVQDTDELAAEEEYLRDCARQYSAEMRFRISSDPASAILAELNRDPSAVPALTTHGRSAWMEAVLGSVALRIIRDAKRPVTIFRPLDGSREAPKTIATVALALDGSRFAERMIPYAVKAAQSLSSPLILIQVLPAGSTLATTEDARVDILESSYLQRKSVEIKAKYSIEADWEVLHGDPGEAICRYLSGSPDTLLAMTTHARTGLQRLVLGSVAAACVRGAGVPLLLYWPSR